MPCAEARKLVQNTQHTLDDMNEFPAVHPRLHLIAAQHPSDTKDECSVESAIAGGLRPALEVEVTASEGDTSFEMSRSTPRSRFLYAPAQRANLASMLAEWLRAVFSDEQHSVAHQIATLSTNNAQAHTFLKSASAHSMQEIVRRDTRAVKTSPTYHLTFSLFTAEGSPSSWTVEAALESHIQPLVAALSAISNFTVTTQIQMYSPFSSAIPLYKVENMEGVFLREDDLSAFVNAAEWPLSPSIGEGPTLHFILYVPKRDQLPLTILEDKGASWLVPQWGGITILNPTLVTHPETGLQTVINQLSEEELAPAFETFSKQLLSLLGVPASTCQGHSLPLSLRLQTKKRLSGLALYFRASSTLGSLARLAEHLSNIPIPKHVASLVDETIANLRESAQNFRDSDWDRALEHSTKAFEQSEKAFFDKAMVGQVYFPDEHKIAVYLPLLGPIGVPLVVGLVREIRRLRGS
jgi:phosphatidylinositol glycan class S